MESRGVEISHVIGPALQASVELLAFTSFGDPTKDPLFRSVDAALCGVLADIARSESFEGKTGQSVIVHTHGKIPMTGSVDGSSGSTEWPADLSGEERKRTTERDLLERFVRLRHALDAAQVSVRSKE